MQPIESKNAAPAAGIWLEIARDGGGVSISIWIPQGVCVMAVAKRLLRKEKPKAYTLNIHKMFL